MSSRSFEFTRAVGAFVALTLAALGFGALGAGVFLAVRAGSPIAGAILVLFSLPFLGAAAFVLVKAFDSDSGNGR